MNTSRNPSFPFRHASVLVAFVLALLLTVLPGRQTGISLAAPARATDACVTIQPDATAGKDAFINQDNVGDNKGGDSELRVKTESGKLLRSALQFNLSSLPLNASVSSATLSLWVKEVRDGNVTINAHQVTSSWDEVEVTWNSRNEASALNWTTAGADYSGTILDSEPFVKDVRDYWATWNVATAAQAWIVNPAANFGLILESPVTSPKNETKFKSSDDGTASERPQLEVCYTELLPDLQISKTLTTAGTIFVGQELSFSISLTNTGQTILDFIPLRDWYDAQFLEFVSATPAPTSIANGSITWDDLVASLGTLAPNATTTVTVRFKALKATTSTVVAAAARSADAAQPRSIQAVAGGTPALDSCGYTYSSAEPRTSIVFNESYILRAFSPSNGGSTSPLDTIKVWYSDEHALTLGVRQVQIKTAGGTTITNYPITAMNTNPADHALNPLVGTTALTGDFASTDLSGRPLWPALFITDITTDPNNRAGDWQYGGTPITPHDLFGTWKGAVRFVDKTRNPAVVTVTPDVNPAKNNWNLAGGETPPSGVDNEGYGALMRWNVAALPLTPGHTYRIQVMIHDGDQNKSGGDTGEACTTITMSPTGSIGDRVWYDANNDQTQQPSEPGLNGVKVSLYGSACPAAGAPLKTLTTASDGNYDFVGLTAGSYCVAVDASTVPAGFGLTTANEPKTVALATLQDYNDADFGYRALCPDGTANLAMASGVNDQFDTFLPNRQAFACVSIAPLTGAIGDFVWFDTDADGIQDVREPGLANVTLDLYRSGVKVATTQTDADGGYLFSDLSVGSYVVDVTDTNGVLVDLLHVVANQSQTDPSMTINLGAGEVYKDADFGYYAGGGGTGGPNPFIGDTVWYDGNGDGIQQPGEPGIPGVTVCATPIAGGVAICKTTNSNGIYGIFLQLAGTYVVAPVSTPGGLTPTTPTARTVTVAQTDRYLDADFGYNGPSLGQIGNLVFDDKNKDGIFNGSDTPLGGVSVSLIRDSDGDGVWDSGEPIIATTTSATALSGSNGNYLFTGVAQGIYLVHVSDTNSVLADYIKSPLGTLGSDGHNQVDPYRVVLGAGSSNLTADFGYYRATGPNTGVIGNQVWSETDGNGIFNPAGSDVGQAGVTVELYKDGVNYATTTTGAGGDYSFASLPAGNYSVNVTDDYSVLAAYIVTSLGPTPGSDNNNQQQPYAITLADGGFNLTADFGYIQLGVIGDYVWYDADSDGVQDIFEPGIGNVTLDAYRNNVKVASTTSDADGGYIFTNLLPGNYSIYVSTDETDLNGALAGLTHTTGAQSQPDPTGVIVITPGTIYRDADFGYVKQPTSGRAILGDFVWYDGDGDGIPDPGEPGIAGSIVCATPKSGGAATCATTNNAGVYQISVLAGTYFVNVTNPPAGYTATTQELHGPVTLAAGEQYLDADFGYDSPNLASLGGTVWRDTNNNGELDASELRIPSVSVDLIRDTNGNGVWNSGEPILATDTSDQNGDYLFVGLPAGNYLLRVSDTQNVLDDYNPTVLGANPGQDNNNQAQPYAVALAAGQTNTTGDFGYIKAGNGGDLGIIGNQLWYEGDGNGVYNAEAGDIGVAGVTVALYRNSILYDTTTTGASGDYVFTSLPAGNYTVSVTDQFGVLTNYILTAFGPNPGQDNQHQAQPYAIVLLAAGVNMTADFGYTRPGAIGDFVWYDSDGDGIQDVGEPGIPNVTLDLYRSGVKIATTTSDADGGYLFPGLKPGVYSVDVTDVNGRLAGLTHIVANQSQTDPTMSINLGAGEVYKDADFGYRNTTSASVILGDFVWYDANGDGFQQPNEPGIAGISLRAVDGVGAVYTQTTNSNGYYLFELPPGAYTVTPVNPPAGLTASTPSSVGPVILLNGQTYLDADFGYTDSSGSILGSIGNLVFEDKNKDGVFNGSDTALGGASVSLIRDLNGNGVWNSGEPIIATTTTASSLGANNSNYLFVGVPAGNYLVHVSDTNAVLTNFIKSPLGTTGSDNNNQADPYRVALAAGGSNLTADFGYYRATRPNSAIIGNQVWMETDGDGLFQPTGDEIGQPGVTIQLYKDGSYYDKTTTGASGDYSFPSLPGGTYSVTVADDFNVLAGFSLSALGPTPGADNNNQAQPYTVALPINGVNLTADFGYVKLVPGQGSAPIGNLVWDDSNADGVYQFGEPGIGGVVVQLWYDTNQNCVVDTGDVPYTPKTTNSAVSLGGNYSFSEGFIDGNYLVRLTDPNFVLVGAPQTVGPNQTADNHSKNQPYCIVNFDAQGIGNLTADFGFNLPDANVAISKKLNTLEPVRTGETISFTIRITNTGSITIVTLPLTDTYDIGYISYAGATPLSNDNISDGVINWSDLTAAAPTGVGIDLAPGASVSVVVKFIAVRDTTLLPNSSTINTAVVSNAYTDVDGPGGAAPQGPLPPKSATDDVSIVAPTSVLMTNASAALNGDQVLLAWTTLNESDLIGLRIYRSENGDAPVQLTEIAAQKPGQSDGAAYTYTDGPVQMGKRYLYTVEFVGANGPLGQETIGELLTGLKLFLPAIQANAAVDLAAAGAPAEGAAQESAADESAADESATDESVPGDGAAQVKLFLPAIGR